MAATQSWILADLVRALSGARHQPEPGAPEPAPLEQLTAACDVLMGDLGEASMRAVADRALAAYRDLEEDAERVVFFEHMLASYSVDDEALRQAYQQWERTRGQNELADLFDASEPTRQQLLRRLNHAPGATLHLVNMRADLRRLLREHPDLAPLDRDFRHLLSSWFNRGFLRMEQVGWDAPRQMRNHLLASERVHPMQDMNDLKRRLRPKDRTCYAFFHPATGDLPLIFVEVALVRGIPGAIEPLLAPTEAISPAKADTAVLYSINNALDGLAGISFGSLLIKQVIDQVSAELPHLEQFVTLSPIPGFRRWLREQSLDPRREDLRLLFTELERHDGAEELTELQLEDLRVRLASAVAHYIAVERRPDGQPLDSVARFHLGNGATAWQLHWPASTADYMWEQSYGAMINYRYEPGLVEQRHEDYVRNGTVALGVRVSRLISPETAENSSTKGTTPVENSAVENELSGIYQGFLAQAQARPEKPLFKLPGGAVLSYAEVLHTSRRIAAKLIGDGVVPGDRVAAQVEKSPEAIALYLATLQIGGVYLPLNTAYTGAEMDYFMSDAAPRVLVCDPTQAADHVRRGKDGIVVETLGTTGDGTLLAAEQEHAAIAETRPEDPGAILYTSGTTGRSKGAVLTNQNLASNCASLVKSWEFTAEDVLIHALPIFHIHGLFVAVNMTLAAGASMIWLPRFEVPAVLDAMEDPTAGATVLMGVPTFYTRLLGSDRFSEESCSGMRLFVSGSAPLLAADHEAFQSRTGHAILERYGMTETGMNTSNPYRGGPAVPEQWDTAARGRGADHRPRERPGPSAGRGRHHRGARCQRLRRVLEHAGEDR